MLYPFDGFEQFDVQRISCELSFEVDERMASGHGLDQQ
jgi:hypothetical protein